MVIHWNLTPSRDHEGRAAPHWGFYLLSEVLDARRPGAPLAGFCDFLFHNVYFSMIILNVEGAYIHLQREQESESWKESCFGDKKSQRIGPAVAAVEKKASLAPSAKKKGEYGRWLGSKVTGVESIPHIMAWGLLVAPQERGGSHISFGSSPTQHLEYAYQMPSNSYL